MDYDTWKTTPPAEPPIVGECAQCGADLYEGCEYVRDTCDDEWYCDTDCFIDKMRGNAVTKTIAAAERDDW